jgi:hypothetical protein
MQELKREAMCDTTDTLLFDILTELKEIKRALKSIPTERVYKPDAEVKPEIPIPDKEAVKKPVNKATTAKKNQSKGR